MNNKILNTATGFIVGLLMIIITKSQYYVDGNKNLLMLGLLLFAMTMVGFGIGNIPIDIVDKPKKRKKRTFDSEGMFEKY